MARKRRRKSSRSRRSRKHRRNGGMPMWFWPALVTSGLVSVWLWKQANPGQSLNPTV